MRQKYEFFFMKKKRYKLHTGYAIVLHFVALQNTTGRGKNDGIGNIRNNRTSNDTNTHKCEY